MIAHLARRIAWALAIVWAVTTLAFFVNNILPSEPARMIAGPQARPKDVERIRSQLGLDQPLLTQYTFFMKRLVHVAPANAQGAPDHATCATAARLHFDLGRSYQQRRAVLTVLGERLPRSLLLASAAVFVQLLLGVTLGVYAAVRKNTLVDYAAVSVSLVGISAPTFLLGVGLQFVLAHKLRLLPLDGYGATAGEHMLSLVLPALTLGIFGAAYYTRLTRDEMLGLLKQDYVRTARAKGLTEWVIVLRHALRNALVPLVTMVGLDLGSLVGSAVVTETLFRWPGIGALSVKAVLDRDGPLIMGTVIVSSVAIVVSNLVVDVCYAALDPRIRK